MKVMALVFLLAFAGREPLPVVMSAAPMSLGGPALQTAGRQCEIPDVTGLSRAAADARLRQADLVIGRIDTRPAEQPAGIVIGQQPACGPRPRDSRVNLVVSSGRNPDTPRPEGGTGTSVGDVAVPLGIAVGAAVLGTILSRRGQDETTVPNLVNLPENAVADTLKKARLRTGEVGKQESMTLAAGRVVSQTPVAGTMVAPESAVSVRISTGRPLIEVPDLTGLDWQGANARTTGARLRMLVTDPQASDFAGMTVASQVPEAGTRVVAGATVGVTLRSAPAAAVAPATTLPLPPPPQQPPPDPPVAAQPAPAQPSPAPPDPVAPTPVAQVPAAPPGSAPPAAPPPDAVVAQVLPPPPAVVPPAAPMAPAVPAAQTIWLWPLLLLLLLGLVPARDAIRKELARRTVPLPASGVPHIVPRVTFIPRLDMGRQAITSGSQESSGRFDFVYHVNGGTQRARFDDGMPRAAQTGAES